MTELPEFETTRAGSERAKHAREGMLTLQTCPGCGKLQYPSREICGHCLSGELSWSLVQPEGRVIATALVHVSQHAFFRQAAPWSICSVLLKAGPRVIAHACDARIQSGMTVAVSDRPVSDGHSVLIARLPDAPTHRKERP